MTTKKTSAVGAIVGSLLLFLLVAGGVVFFLIRRRNAADGTDNYYSFPEDTVSLPPLPPVDPAAPPAIPLPAPPPANNELERRINDAFYPAQAQASAADTKPKADDLPDMFELANQRPETFGNLHYENLPPPPVAPPMVSAAPVPQSQPLPEVEPLAMTDTQPPPGPAPATDDSTELRISH